jgi:hypothetical protein
MGVGRTRKKAIPKGRDAHGNAVPLSVTRIDDKEQADADNLAQRRGKPEVGTMAKAPSSARKTKH